MATPVAHRSKASSAFDPNFSYDKCKPKRVLFTIAKGCARVVHGSDYEGCEYRLVKLVGKCGTVELEVTDAAGEPVMATESTPSFALVAPGRYQLKPIDNGANYLTPQFEVESVSFEQLKAMKGEGAAYGI